MTPPKSQTAEPSMTINGRQLDPAHVMTIRVALASLAVDLKDTGLGSDAHGLFMTAAYQARISEINQIMFAASGR